jgi:hypothetical protein
MNTPNSQPAQPDARRFWRYPVACCLAGVALVTITAPFDEYFDQRFQAGSLFEALRLTVILLVALLAVGPRARTLAWCILLVVASLTSRWGNHLWPESVAAWFHIIPGGIFMVFVIGHLLRFVLCAPRVNSEILCASMVTYLLLGWLWSAIYVVMSQWSPGAFASTLGSPAAHSLKNSNALYFSFITITTTGYGDIVPVSPAARMLAMMEAVTGTLYMTVLVARLVSLYSVPPPSGEVAATGKTTEPPPPSTP